MSDPKARRAVRARWVVPVTSPPLDGGVLTLCGDQIVAVGENSSGRAPLDLGDVAILPGLINAHTHLEFSELPAPLGQRGMPLPAWIDQVVSLRRERAEQSEAVLSEARKGLALQTGFRQCLQGGATRVADIVTCDLAVWQAAAGACQLLTGRTIAFCELIGLAPPRIKLVLSRAEQAIGTSQASNGLVAIGLSPHAPYTAAPELIERVVELSRQFHAPVAMHLAESPEELQLLQHGEGPFRALLEKFGAWHAASHSGGTAALDYLQMLAAAHRALVVHGNYLVEQEWEFLARHRDTMSLVYCPRTHEYFAHPSYPLRALLDVGVRVVLGTDGRGSNPDLNIFREFQCAANRHPDVPVDALLRTVTLDAAQALGCANEAGSLQVGKLADFTLIDISGTSTAVPVLPSLLDPAASVREVWIGGTARP